MHFNNVDIFDAAFVLIMAYVGLSRGLLGTILVIVGSVISVKFFPKFIVSVMHKFSDRLPQAYMSLTEFVLLIIIGYLLGIIVHKIFSGAVRGGLFGVCDRLLSAALHAIGAAFLLWLTIPMVLGAVPYSVAQQMHHSILVNWAQKYIPHWLENMPQVIEKDMEHSLLGAKKSLNAEKPISLPELTDNISPAQQEAARAVVKIVSLEPKCQQEIAGTGFYFRFHYILTNAHVIAGSDSISIHNQASISLAIPVYFNPDEDIAVLYDATVAGTPLDMAQDADNSSNLVAIGYPGGGNLAITHEKYKREENLQSSNIYGQIGISRRVLVLYGGVHHGNSGGPVVNSEGKVMGMIFGAENHNNKIVYGLSLSELNKYLFRPYGYDAVDTGQCVLN